MLEDAPAGLGERGLALYRRFAGSDVAVNALALEAARSADRLDELDSIIQGKGVLNLMQFRLRELPDLEAEAPTCTVEVQFQSVLAEARQQQATFSALLAKLLPLTGVQDDEKPAPAIRGTPGRPAGGGTVTPLEAARSAAGRR